MRYFLYFNDPAPTEIYTLSLHDALPISEEHELGVLALEHLREHLARGDEIGSCSRVVTDEDGPVGAHRQRLAQRVRSEEHTSELQSHSDLVCRLLLEKKKKATHD